MSQIVFGPNKAYPSVPTVGNDLDSHSRAIETLREAVAIHERRTRDVLDSFVRVGELVDLGLIDVDGAIVTDDGADTDASDSHNHDSLYIRLDGSSPPTTGTIEFGASISIKGGVSASGEVTAATFAGITSTDLLDKSAVETVTGSWTIQSAWDFEAAFQIGRGNTFRIYDVTDTDFMQIQHDGTDINFTHATTTDWNINGITAIQAGTVDAAFNAVQAGGGLKTADGSASSPGISFTAETNTGFYRSAVQEIKLSLNGVPSYTINRGHFRNIDGTGLSTGAKALVLRGGSSNHVYAEWYADARLPNRRSCYAGYEIGGTDEFTLRNEKNNGSVIIKPAGLGNVTLGNYTFDGDQTITAAQDGQVLTYRHDYNLIVLQKRPDVTKIQVSDTRSVNDPPNHFGGAVEFNLKTRSVLGFPGNDTQGGVMTLAPATSAVDGPNYQLAFSNYGTTQPTLSLRTGDHGTLATDWNGWSDILLSQPGTRNYRIYSSVRQNYLQISHDGTDALFDSANTTSFNFNNAYVQSRYGFHGGYSEAPGSNWAANIWSFDAGFTGGASGSAFTLPAGAFGLAWVRERHALNDTFAGEGLYLYRASNTPYAAIGRSGAYFDADVRVDAGHTLDLRGGTARWYDTSNVHYIEITHGGSLATISTIGTADIAVLHTGVERFRFRRAVGTGHTSYATLADHAGHRRDVGFNNLRESRTNISFTLAAEDAGNVAHYTNGTNYTVTLAASTSLDFPVGARMDILNRAAGTISIGQGTGTTLYWAGSGGAAFTTGNRNLIHGWCKIWRQSSTVYYITGNGLT